MRALFAVLRHRDFRNLWFAHSASVLGDGIVVLALALYVTDLTGSATDLGLVLAASALPLLGFMLIGGVWGDRLPRQRLMIGTDLVRFALHATLAGLIVFGTPEIWQIVVIEALFGTAEAFFRPAATALVPQTVPEAEIQEASALMTMTSNVSEFAGPALATALVLGFSAGAAFALDALTFLVSAGMLTRVRARERASGPLAQPEASEQGTFSAIRAGFAEVRSRVWLWATLLAFSIALFAGLAPEFVLGPSIAEEQYGSSGIYGAFATAFGAGNILGSLIGIRWRPLHPMRMAMIFAASWPLASILYGAGVLLAVVIPATVAAGVAIALFDVWFLTAQAERVPPNMLSRVSSFDWAISLSLLPLGFLLAGPLAEAIGDVEVLIGGSAIASIALLLGLLPRETRMLERLHTGPEDRT
jgi:predicted MFS family arabinose efflux permease